MESRSTEEILPPNFGVVVVTRHGGVVPDSCNYSTRHLAAEEFPAKLVGNAMS